MALLLAAAFVGIAACGRDDEEAGAASGSPGSSPATTAESAPMAERTPPRFVGSATCIACHADEATGWQTSQHRVAMAIATQESVAAPFAGEELLEKAEKVSFFRQGSGYFVRGLALGATRIDPNATGDRRTLRITGTFGVAPLQQYLTDPELGRIQVLPWAWDTRPESSGGQRWLDLYPETSGDPSHPLHFSRPSQNWNHVCADCHVTGFRKRYEAERDRFASRWEELGVGCEACHGPGSAHVAWAARRERAPDAADEASADGKGLFARLDERVGVRWTIDPATGIAVRSTPRATARELEVCAPCHSRRSAISEDWVAGERFLDHYRPSLLEPGLYWADGQQRDEVYDWGSFLQSRMHAAGVTCSDCHDPHSGRPRAAGNALCATCHATAKFATPAHHHHAPGSSGSECVACHMPTTTYMQIDPRHDHSLRVPRPDQARALGVPDACGSCHGSDRSAWSAAAVERWLGRPARGFARHAEAFAADEAEALDGGVRLRAVAGDASQPAIVRASALARLDASGAGAARLLAAAVRDPEPLVRLGALEALSNAPPASRRAAVPALGDGLRAVRFEAVRALAPIAEELALADHRHFEREAAAYEASLRRDADRPEARTQLGLFLAERGDADRARRELEAAIAIEPAYEAAHANLADLERALGQDEAALRVLDAGLAQLPESAALEHARGLALVRLGRAGEAMEALARAVELDPGSSRFAYVHAVALHGAGERERAIALLERTAAAHPAEPALREALVAFLEAEGDVEAAARHRAVLARLAEQAQ